MAVLVTAPWLLAASGAAACVGYTLLTYSKDGDLALRAGSRANPFADAQSTSREQAWGRLSALANASATEVTWNTSIAVALVSSVAFVGLAAFLRGGVAPPPPPAMLGATWLLALFTVFGLQDVVQRWKQAHRKNATAQEQLEIIQRLRWAPVEHG
jgi:hypothetical protein